jgi:hypothetical protein
LLALATLAIAGLEIRRPLPIAPLSMIPFFTACAPLVAVAWFYSRVRPREKLAVVATALLQILTFSALGCVLQYLLAREGGPLWSATLYRWDQSLGLDWQAMARGLNDRPTLYLLLGIAYKALIPEAVAIAVLLGWKEQLYELRTFILAGMVAGGVSIAINSIMPSTDCSVFLQLSRSTLPNLDFNLSYAAADELEALRAGKLTLIRLSEMQGIVTFPSYHAGLATASCWASLNSKSRWGIFGAMLAIATIVSAPIRGGHYFIDIAFGVAIGAASIFAASRLVRLPGLRPSFTALPFRRSRAAFAR